MIDGVRIGNAKTNITDEHLSYNGLHFKKNNFGGYVIRGSLHKFHNNGEHNADDFNYSDFAETIAQLQYEIGLNPRITVLNRIEFGVNIKLPYSPEMVVNRLILFKSNAEVGKRSYKEFRFKDYSLKIYNKSAFTKIKPYQTNDILRVEMSCRMKHLKGKVYFRTLSDLLDLEIWERLERILIQAVSESLIIDLNVSEINNLSEKNKIRYFKYINPLYWNELHKDRVKLCREKKRCETFLNCFSTSTMKHDLINLISAKCKELRTVSITEKCNILHIKMNVENVAGNKPIQIYCKGCGKLILHPRKGQIYCSGKEVGYNQAHQCRNRNSNPRNNTQRAIRRLLSSPLMFDLSETIAPEKSIYLECLKIF